MAFVATELATLSWWFLSVQFETGVDALQYHRMTRAIMQDGLAPWILHPLSYIGIYPGSDSSGVPFLAASFSLLAGNSISLTVLVYDAVLLLVFGLGLFILTRQLTDREDIALIAVLMGSLAYGFFTTLAWSLDERSFNVALTPLFLYLLIPGVARTSMKPLAPRLTVLGLMCVLMFIAHLSFLLLLPFLILIPLITEVLRRQHSMRRSRRASLLYFGAIGISPLALLIGLNQLGVLSGFGLEYQLESSALFSGASPLIFLLNAIVFLATRVGPVDVLCTVVGLIYLATRPQLVSRGVAVGGFLLAGFLGLPIVLYSKDLLTPIFVLLGAIGLGGFTRHSSRRRLGTLALVTIIVIAGSAAFDAWNSARVSRAIDATYWAMPGVTPEAQDGSLWIGAMHSTDGCLYGNNAVLLQQVTTEPGEPYCTGLGIDALINLGPSATLGPSSIDVRYVGITGINPSGWFASANLDRISSDFARLPTLSLQAGRNLLLRYGVRFIVVDMQKPEQMPLYQYQGTWHSQFFAELWTDQYPLYETSNVAVFQVM